tara:strand:- start:200 stop:337 length:138 start_codon:yes stop_codon:yes gene_type:complete
MPVWLRKFYLNELVDFRKKEKEEHDRISKKGQSKPPKFSNSPPRR